MRQLHFVCCKRSLPAGALGVIALLVADSFAAEIAPYEARVSVARGQVRSGPGEQYYPTAALEHGHVVEVYREQSGGWLAIRPPDESFSWVRGEHLKLRDDGLAEVSEPDVPSRIGSHFGSRRNAVQVRLQKGEIVELLGEQAAGNTTWYQIAPPAGEFRWIHTSQVRPEQHPNITTTTAIATDPDQAPIVTVPSESSMPPPDEDRQERTPAGEASPTIVDEAWRSANQEAKPAASPTDATPAAPASDGLGAAPPPADNLESSEPEGVLDPTDALARELVDIEVRLSRMVAQSPDRWDIEPLEQHTEQLLAQAETTAERDMVKATLGKIDRFRAIGQRYRHGLAPDGARVAQAGQPPITPVTAPPAGALDGGRAYDAVGILRPVVSRRPGAPQFALVDERGQVLSFVTPTPDVNLQPYIGHRIGISGSRGFIPEFQRAHVTAGRVAPLDDRLVR